MADYTKNEAPDQCPQGNVLPAPFRLHDIVRTKKGAEFWGEIIALDHDPHSPGCTVLAIAPGFRRTKHVYPLAQIEHFQPESDNGPGSALTDELQQEIADVLTQWGLPGGSMTVARIVFELITRDTNNGK